MSINTRLQKVTPGLTALERFRLFMEAQRSGREVEPDVIRINDARERAAFRRYVALAYAIERELGNVSRTVSERVTACVRANEHAGVFAQAAAYAEEYDGLTRPVKAPRDWRTAPSLTVPKLLRGLAKEMRDEALVGLVYRWKELRALEIVHQELTEEFGGEDPTNPEIAAEMVATRNSLLGLADSLGAKRRLAEPEEDLLNEYRQFVNSTFRSLGVIGVYE